MNFHFKTETKISLNLSLKSEKIGFIKKSLKKLCITPISKTKTEKIIITKLNLFLFMHYTPQQLAIPHGAKGFTLCAAFFL